MRVKECIRVSLLFMGVIFLSACVFQGNNLLPASEGHQSAQELTGEYTYLIGPGDTVSIFVWRNPEISNTITVRPDGKITSPLVEELVASGKSPAQLAREIEKILSTYIKEPIVTVLISGFVGPYSEQIRIVGEAANPQALPYKKNMTALDVMIAVGGLTEFAAGNNAQIVRIVDGEQKEYRVKLTNLLRKGDISANVDMVPGDILIIPESFF